MTRPLNVGVLLTAGGNLRQWENSGTFDRQLALYRELQNRGMRITMFSPGGRGDLDFASRLPGMRILVNSMGLPSKLYTRRLHQIHAASLLHIDVLRTDASGAMIEGLSISWAWQIPLICRVSYIMSEVTRIVHADKPNFATLIEGQERKTWSKASHIIATTPEVANHIVGQVPIAKDKLTVIPNHVDTQIFRPATTAKRYDLIYVGRITSVKNLEALLTAVKQLDVTIAIIGSGTILGDGTTDNQEPNKLQSMFGDLDGRIHWLGRIKNEDLPTYLNQAKLFVLCSLSEGHPRALVEAMACGLPCIGTNVPGVSNVLLHAVTGYLCNTDADSIGAAIETVLAQPDLMRKMGDNARNYAVENYSLPMLAQQEYELLVDVARRHPVDGAIARISRYFLRRHG